MKEKTHDLKGKNVLIVGLGKSGIAATQAMVKLGAKVSVQDKSDAENIEPQLISFLQGANVHCHFGRPPKDMSGFDILILSPGVSPELDFIKEAAQAGAEIIGELEIAYRIGSGKYIAITGTNGKTTTTTLTGAIFKKAKEKTYVVGNIGVAVISKALSAESDAWLVTETSSFQLETIKYFKPVVSAILNLTPDHMDRHKNMDNYANAKGRVFENQDESEYAVINYDDELCLSLARQCKARVVPFSRKEALDFGVFVQDHKIVIKNESGQLVSLCKVDELQIPGAHNLENALAAAAIAYFAGIEPDVISDTLRAFQGVEHRLEYAGEVDGIRFVNDSKGTNTDASIKAVEAMNGGVILIAGGYDKKASFDALIQSFDGKVKHMVLLGQTAPLIKETGEKLGFHNSIIEKDMDDCVRSAFKLAEPGDTVLLSPACASWDMYDNFEQRGGHFKDCVHRLEK